MVIATIFISQCTFSLFFILYNVRMKRIILQRKAIFRDSQALYDKGYRGNVCKNQQSQLSRWKIHDFP